MYARRTCGQAIAPVKNASFKITIDSNRQPPSLAALFEDVCPQDGPAAAPNVLSFQYHCGADCTIIVSKNSVSALCCDLCMYVDVRIDNVSKM